MRALAAVFLVGAALVAAVVATPAFGDTSGPVSATVTAVAPCVKVIGTGSLDFGSKQFSTASANSFSEQTGPEIDNCSGANASIWGSVTTATNAGAAVWNIATPGAPATHCAAGGALTPNNKFAVFHSVSVGDERFLGSGATLIQANKTVGALNGYKLDLFMPCTGSSGGGTTMAFTVNFTATIP